MPDSVIVQLPADALPRLPDALAAVTPKDGNRFMAALELAYLAASADGFDDAERATMAATLERVTTAHFADLDEAVASLGRRERLARTAADLDTDGARAEAIQFAALVAMADGTLRALELGVLTEAGTHFEWTADQVRTLVTEAAARVGGRS
jgi:hypothetical protein